MRLKSAALVVMLVWWAANFGDQSRSSASNSSLVWLPERFQNTADALVSASPERSIASMVLANVGAAGSDAIAAISASWALNPASNAGPKCSGPISANGGASNGVVRGSSSGFLAEAVMCVFEAGRAEKAGKPLV